MLIVNECLDKFQTLISSSNNNIFYNHIVRKILNGKYCKTLIISHDFQIFLGSCEEGNRSPGNVVTYFGY